VRVCRFLGSLVALTACAAIEAAPAEYVASVQQGYVARSAVQRIALAPFACTREIECVEFEEDLVERLEKATGLEIVTSGAVHELMTQAGMTDIAQYENRLIIAEGLGVHAFAFVDVHEVHAGVVAPPEHDKWRDIRRETTVKQASMAFRVVAPDGTSLAQVSGKAEVFGSARSLQSITTHLFEVMLERVWN
jgi:hypothetical protein